MTEPILFEFDTHKKILDLVFRQFDYNLVKTIRWMSTQNPHLGNVAPIRLLELGREEKVLNFVRATIEENSR